MARQRELRSAAAMLGRKGGQVGGRSRSPAKVEAARRTIAEAREALRAKRTSEASRED